MMTTTKHPSHLMLALTAGTMLGACSARTAPSVPEAATPIPIRTAPIAWARRARPVRATGTLSGKEEINLSFKIGGLVERVVVDEGARVSVGQTLVTLKRSELSAGALQARRAFEKATRDRERVDELYRGRAATLEQSQNAQTAVDLARAALDAAAFNEEHAVIRAPAAGTILRRMVEPDELVAAGTPVLRLRASGRGWIVRAGVSDRDVMRVALGDPVVVTFGAVPETSFAAAVSEIAESATPMTGTYELELRLDATPVALRSGLIAQVTIRPAVKTTTAFIPLEALIDGNGDRAVVYVPKVTTGAAGRSGVERRNVRVAFVDGAEAAIATGLEGATAVVTDGAARLSGSDPQVEIARAEVSP